MVEATVTQVLDLPYPGIEVALIEVSDGETYTCKKLGGIWGALLLANRDNAAADSWGVTFTNGGRQATIELIGSVTDLKATIILFGTQ